MTIGTLWLVTSRRKIDLLHSFVNARIRSCLSEASKDNLVRLRHSASGTIANGVTDRAASQEGEARSQARKTGSAARCRWRVFFWNIYDQNSNISALSVGVSFHAAREWRPHSSRHLGCDVDVFEAFPVLQSLSIMDGSLVCLEASKEEQRSTGM